MSRFDAATAREASMEFFYNTDNDEEEEKLLDLEECLIQNGEVTRTEDITQAHRSSNRIF